MIQDLSESEILDYLMTSEFEEGLTPEEFKFLLYKFRNFYRVASCSISNHKDRMELAINESNKIKNEKIEVINKLESEKLQVEKKYSTLLNKKLTWAERFKGKIILEDEN